MTVRDEQNVMQIVSKGLAVSKLVELHVAIVLIEGGKVENGYA